MRTTAFVALFVLAMSGCVEPVVPVGEGPGVAYAPAAHIPPRFEPELDLLFVVDNTAGMVAKQAELAKSFERLVAQLEFFEYEGRQRLPDLHIGVVSTDMGVGASYAVPGCDSSGDSGVLHSAPSEIMAPLAMERVRGTDGTIDLESTPGEGTARFLVDIDAGGGRATNYSSTLEHAFTNMVQLGSQGCEIEQPLAAMRAVLDGSRAENAGFVRDNAALAVVVLSNEDDCSVADERFFDPALDSDDPDFRCFVRSAQCNDDVVAEGSYSGCRPRQSPEFMHDVGEYKSFLTSMRRSDSVVVAAMAGDSSDAEIVTRSDGTLSVAAQCEDRNETYPAVRLQQFISEFTGQGDLAPQCGDQAVDALAATGKRIRKMLGTPCMDGAILDTDLDEHGVQPTCNVWMQRSSDPEDPYAERESLPACTAPAHRREQADAPCYYIDEGGCGDYFGPQLKLFVWWGMNEDGTWRAQPADKHVFAECLVATSEQE